MKKNSDIDGLIIKLEERLLSLEKKIDVLISQASVKTFERKQDFSSPQRFDPSQRILHKAVCADCKKECEVPFKPAGDRPVYCKECFSKRKAGDSFKPKTYNRPAEANPRAARPFYKRYTGENRKSGASKRRASGRRKKRA